jgi:hypothetical protein
MIYKHIGYYNNVEDTKELFDATPDEVASYLKNGYGEFHASSTFDDIDTQNIVQPIINKLCTSDKKHIVIKSLPSNIDDLTEDYFIDVYEVE